MHRFFSILLVFSFLSLNAFSGHISGTLKSKSGEPLAFANVYVKNTTYGVSTNLKGYYFLELKSGTYTIVYSYVGFETLEKEIVIPDKEGKVLDIVLTSITKSLSEVEIVTKYEDKSKMIMRNVREKRKFYLSQIENYKCQTYTKTSLEKELIKVKEKDTVASRREEKKGIEAKTLEEALKKQGLNLVESMSETYYQTPSKYKEIVLAHHDYTEKRDESGRSITLGLEYEEEDIIPEDDKGGNPYVLYKDISSCEFNFYKSLINFPALNVKPFLSPIGANSELNYKYKIINSFIENEKKIYEIDVKPLFLTDALFSGVIFIEDSSWALLSVDLQINKAAMTFCKEFKIIQNYNEIQKNIFLPVRRELIFTIHDGRHNILGNTRVNHSDYEINIEMPSNFFNSEIRRFAVDAFVKDSTFWEEKRPITLKESELEYVRNTDSINAYFTSDEYYRKLDSAFNRVTFWLPLVGYGHRNRAKGNEYYIEGLLSQVQPLGIGGYRHKLPGYFNKELKNDMLIEAKGFVDYGFRNEDIKAQLGVGWTYLPKKFVRTFIEIGDYYDRVNDYAAVEKMFSMSNYVRVKSYKISQRMEIVNGLFAELSFLYSDQQSLSDVKLAEWTKQLFGEVNKPMEFERYTKSEIKLETKYRFKQKYVIKENKKIVIGSDYPEIHLIYRKGIPNLFNSEVNFDYIELGAGNQLNLARFGSSRWEVVAGSFLNKSDLRTLEHKYFRGSDRIFFSNPVRSFQLMGLTETTSNEFLKANYIHHFEGSIMDKIPLVNRLKLSISAGAGTLLIPDSDLSHFEMFAGLEKTFRIKKQLFRFGVYAVTAENSISKNDFTLKFGIDFYNTFTNKWSY